MYNIIINYNLQPVSIKMNLNDDDATVINSNNNLIKSNDNNDDDEIIGDLIKIKIDWKCFGVANFFNQIFNQKQFPSNEYPPNEYPPILNEYPPFNKKYDKNLVHLVKLKKKDIAHQSNYRDFLDLYTQYKGGEYSHTRISPTNFQKFLENNQEYYTKLCIYEEFYKKYKESEKAYIDELMSQIE